MVVGGAVFALFALRTSSATSTGPVTVTGPAVVPATAVKPVASAGSDVATQVLSFGDEGNGPGQLTDARTIAVDMDENVYVADYASGRVQKFDATGKFQWIISVPKNSFSGDLNIFGLAVDTKKTLWVARTGDLLQFATADGKATGTIKGDYDSTWFRYVALDPLGNIATTHYAAGNSDFLRLDPKGKVTQRVKNKEPKGLALDGAGNAYLTGDDDGVVEVLDPKGAVKSRFGSKKDKHTAGASAIAVDGKGHIFLEASEGINVLDEGGAYIATLPYKGGMRSLAVSTKGNVFLLTNTEKVLKFTPGPGLK
jgi:DNA-binding beta-propeller fold protein YncE